MGSLCGVRINPNNSSRHLKSTCHALGTAPPACHAFFSFHSPNTQQGGPRRYLRVPDENGAWESSRVLPKEPNGDRLQNPSPLVDSLPLLEMTM